MLVQRGHEVLQGEQEDLDLGVDAGVETAAARLVETQDQPRKVGYSKQRRADPQIVVGLLLDRNGFLLEIGSFEGEPCRDPHDRADHPAVPSPP